MSTRLSSLLVQASVVSVRQIERALERQVLRGGQLDTNLLELGVKEEDLLPHLGKARDLLPATRSVWPIPDKEVLNLVPKELAQKNELALLGKEGGRLYVLTHETFDASSLASLSKNLGLAVIPVIIPEFRVHEALERYYHIPIPPRSSALVSKFPMQAPTWEDVKDELPWVTNSLQTASPAKEKEAQLPEKTVVAPTPFLAREAKETSTSNKPPALHPSVDSTDSRKTSGQNSLNRLTQDFEEATHPDQILFAALHFTQQPNQSVLLFQIQATPYSAIGRHLISPAQKPSILQDVVIPVEESPTIQRVLQLQAFQPHVTLKDASLLHLFETLQLEQPALIFLLPIVLKDRVVAILLGGESPKGDARLNELALIGPLVSRALLSLIRKKKAGANKTSTTHDSGKRLPVFASPSQEESVEENNTQPEENLQPTLVVSRDKIQKTSVKPASQPNGSSSTNLQTTTPKEDVSWDPDEIVTVPRFEQELPKTPYLVSENTPKSFHDDSGEYSIDSTSHGMKTLQGLTPPINPNTNPSSGSQPSSQQNAFEEKNPFDKDENSSFTTVAKENEISSKQKEESEIVLPPGIDDSVDLDNTILEEDIVLDEDGILEEIKDSSDSYDENAITDKQEAERPPSNPIPISLPLELLLETERLEQESAVVNTLAELIQSKRKKPSPPFSSNPVPVSKVRSSRSKEEKIEALIELIDLGQTPKGDVASEEALKQAAKQLIAFGETALQKLLEQFPGRRPPGLQNAAASDEGGLIRTILRFGTKALKGLAKLSSSTDPTQRLYATWCIASMKQEEIIPILLDRLFDEAPLVTQFAANGLFNWRMRFPDHPAFTQVIATLKRAILSQNSSQKIHAAKSVRELRLIELLHDLVFLLEDIDSSVVEAAQYALVNLTFQNFGNKKKYWLSWFEKNLQKPREAWLIEALSDRNVELRKAASSELYFLTKHTFGYDPEGAKSDRKKSIKKWEDWLQNQNYQN